MGWERHKLLWDGYGTDMSHGQPCGFPSYYEDKFEINAVYNEFTHVATKFWKLFNFVHFIYFPIDFCSCCKAIKLAFITIYFFLLCKMPFLWNENFWRLLSNPAPELCQNIPRPVEEWENALQAGADPARNFRGGNFSNSW